MSHNIDLKSLSFKVDFNKAKEELESGGGEYTFVSKYDKLIARLVFQPHLERKDEWYSSYISEFEGKPITNYIIKAVVINRERKLYTPTILVVKKSHLNQIVEISRQLEENEGINIFDMNSLPLSFTKSGSGMDTRYSVLSLTKNVDISAYYFSWDEPLGFYAAEMSERMSKKEQAPNSKPAQQVKSANNFSGSELDELFES